MSLIAFVRTSIARTMRQTLHVMVILRYHAAHAILADIEIIFVKVSPSLPSNWVKTSFIFDVILLNLNGIDSKMLVKLTITR